MKEERRSFLKKALTGAAAVGVAGVSASAVTPENLKKDSGKKSETLYQKTPNWEIYYKQAK